MCFLTRFLLLWGFVRIVRGATYLPFVEVRFTGWAISWRAPNSLVEALKQTRAKKCSLSLSSDVGSTGINTYIIGQIERRETLSRLWWNAILGPWSSGPLEWWSLWMGFCHRLRSSPAEESEHVTCGQFHKPRLCFTPGNKEISSEKEKMAQSSGDHDAPTLIAPSPHCGSGESENNRKSLTVGGRQKNEPLIWKSKTLFNRTVGSCLRTLSPSSRGVSNPSTHPQFFFIAIIISKCSRSSYQWEVN